VRARVEQARSCAIERMRPRQNASPDTISTKRRRLPLRSMDALGFSARLYQDLEGRAHDRRFGRR
jgi:hypothetical protein